jgi:hypothetical protein
MEHPGHGILGWVHELGRVESFIGSVSEGPLALLSCRAAEPEAPLSYTALVTSSTSSCLICLRPRSGAGRRAPASGPRGCSTGPACGVGRVAGGSARTGCVLSRDRRGRRCPVAGRALGQGSWRSRFVVWRMRRSGPWSGCGLGPAATRSPGPDRASTHRSPGACRAVARGGNDPPAESSNRGASPTSHPGSGPPDLGGQSVVREIARALTEQGARPAPGEPLPHSGRSPGAAPGTARRATGQRRRWAPRRRPTAGNQRGRGPGGPGDLSGSATAAR